MKISVALCTFNGAKYLSRQLESIFLQTHPVDEIIICDDISSDDTVAIIKDFQNKYANKINLIINENNLGPKHNFEKVINVADGDIIFLCDQDDTWPLNKVEKVVQAFNDNPDVLGVFTNGIIVDENENPTGMGLWESFMYTPYIQSKLTTHSLFESILRNLAIVTGATLAFKKEAKTIILPFKHSKLFWHDEWIGYKLAAKNKLLPYNVPLFNYRIHPLQQVGVYIDDYTTRSNTRERYFKHQFKPGEERLYIAFLYDRLKEARRICNLLNVRFDVLSVLESKFKVEKKRGLRKLPFLKRKALLIKWTYEHRFETTLRDAFVI